MIKLNAKLAQKFIILAAWLVTLTAHAQLNDEENQQLKTIFFESRKVISEVMKEFPIDEKLVDFVTHSGARTDFQLQKVYQKCISAETETITIGAVGGSITTGVKLGNEFAYPSILADYIKNMCPRVKLKVVNASQNATGSLTTGLCLDSYFNGEEIDIFLVDFTLNDGIKYKYSGKQDNSPYELLIRNAMTHGFISQPAIFGIYFWGNGFKRNYTTQKKHSEILTNYNIAAISMNDMVWRFINRKVIMYDTKVKIVIDGHHPNKSIHKLTAGMVSMYIARIFLKYAIEDAKNIKHEDGGLFQNLPAPINKNLERFDFEADRSFRCEMSSLPSRIPIVFSENQGWTEKLMVKPIGSNADTLVCYIPETSDAFAIWEVEVVKDGIVIICNCITTGGALTSPPAFQVQVETQGNNGYQTKSFWHQLRTRNLIGRIGECFEIRDPLISNPGIYRLKITPSEQCLDEWEVANPYELNPPDVVPCNQIKVGIRALVVM